MTRMATSAGSPGLSWMRTNDRNDIPSKSGTSPSRRRNRQCFMSILHLCPGASRPCLTDTGNAVHQKYIFSKGISYCDTPNETPLSSRTWTALVRE